LGLSIFSPPADFSFFKYQFAFSLASDLAKAASSVLEANHPLMFLDKVLLVSIPAAEERVRWRGFNQTEIIGRLIAQRFGWRFSPNLLYRKRRLDHRQD